MYSEIYRNDEYKSDQIYNIEIKCHIIIYIYRITNTTDRDQKIIIETL